jgi:apolipoprotein N-acyltransferase
LNPDHPSGDAALRRVRGRSAPRGGAVTKRWLAVFAAGALAVAGFAPLGFYPATLLGVAVLFAFWLGAASARAAFADGLVFGLGLFGVGVSWIYVSLHDFGGMPAWLAALATFLFCTVLALFPALAGYLAVRLGSTRAARLVLVPALWVLLEWTRGWLFTGFPWLAIGYSQVPASPLAGFAPVLGVYGVSLAAATSAALVAWALTTRVGRWRALAGAAGIALAGLALTAQAFTRWDGSLTRVALVQGNVPQAMKWEPGQVADTLVRYARLADATRAPLIILPETALPVFEAQLPAPYRERLNAIGRENGGDVLAGLPTGSAEGPYYNSVVSFGVSPTQRYHKVHLVPFGEFIPAKAVWGWVVAVLHIPLSDFSPGRPDQPPLAIGGMKVAPNICYEDAFGEEIVPRASAANLLVNVSNDAWFGDSFALWQHAQMSQARALESGRMMLRATNSGLTAIIDRRGRLVAHLPPFREGVLEGDVRGYAGVTPYARFGNAPVVAIVLAGVVAGFLRAVRRRR